MPKDDITVDVVRCLVREQFPQWAGLEIRPVDLDGWDNTTFRLGDDMSVRLPSGDPLRRRRSTRSTVGCRRSHRISRSRFRSHGEG